MILGDKTFQKVAVTFWTPCICLQKSVNCKGDETCKRESTQNSHKFWDISKYDSLKYSVETTEIYQRLTKLF